MTIPLSSSISSPTASNTSSSWICRTIRLFNPACVIDLSTSIMAILMMSAEVPCMGAFTAFLSASALKVPFLEFMSGIYLLLPKSVST